MDERNKKQEDDWTKLINTITSMSSMGVHIVDLHTREMYFSNEAGFRLIGEEPCDYKGQKCYEVFFGADHPCDNCRMEETKAGITKHETYVPEADRTFLTNTEITTWNNKEVFVEYITDITSFKQKELKLQEAKDIYQRRIEMIMQSYPNALGSLVMNLSKDYVYSQKRLHSFIEEFSDKKISDYLADMKKQMPESDYINYVNMFSRESLMEKYHNGEQHVDLIHRYQFKDRMRWISTIVRILTNPISNDIEAYVFAVDVSEKVIMDRVVKKLINFRYDILALIYPADGFVDFRYTGNQFKQFPVMTIAEYEKNRQQSALLFGEEGATDYINNTEMTRIIQQLDAEESYSFVMTIMIDNEKQYKRYAYNYLTDDHDVIIATVQDVTQIYDKEQKQMEVIQEALREAELANAAKTDFLSRMSHDIRTPMNAIINMTRFAREDYHGTGTGNVDDDLDKVESTSQFLLNLINDILDVSRIESGKMDLHPSVYSYDEFGNYIESMIVPLCEQKHIHFEWNRASTSQPVYFDKVRFNQLIFNILSNAVKFTPENGRVSMIESDVIKTKESITQTFSIIDTGCGMSEAFQEKMFEPFSRDQGTEKIQGTGLGLTIVKKIVDLMNGTLKVTSEIGKGSTFSVRLTIPFATEEQIAKSLEINDSLESYQKAIEGKRVLIAEDHDLNRKIITRLLQDRNMEVIQTENGQEVIEAFLLSKPNSIDAILMDVRMPVHDGLYATREIRKLTREDAMTIPIIAMTANAFEEDRKLSREAGMSDFLTKPIEPQLLYKILAKNMVRR